jgi:hypothetical protein
MATLNLSMPEEDKEAIKLLTKEVNAASVSEFLRDAAPVYSQIWRTIKRGGTVVLRDTKGKERELVIPRLINPY